MNQNPDRPSLPGPPSSWHEADHPQAGRCPAPCRPEPGHGDAIRRPLYLSGWLVVREGEPAVRVGSDPVGAGPGVVPSYSSAARLGAPRYARLAIHAPNVVAQGVVAEPERTADLGTGPAEQQCWAISRSRGVNPKHAAAVGRARRPGCSTTTTTLPSPCSPELAGDPCRTQTAVARDGQRGAAPHAGAGGTAARAAASWPSASRPASRSCAAARRPPPDPRRPGRGTRAGRRPRGGRTPRGAGRRAPPTPPGGRRPWRARRRPVKDSRRSGKEPVEARPVTGTRRAPRERQLVVAPDTAGSGPRGAVLPRASLPDQPGERAGPSSAHRARTAGFTTRSAPGTPADPAHRPEQLAGSTVPPPAPCAGTTERTTSSATARTWATSGAPARRAARRSRRRRSRVGHVPTVGRGRGGSLVLGAAAAASGDGSWHHNGFYVTHHCHRSTPHRFRGAGPAGPRSTYCRPSGSCSTRPRAPASRSPRTWCRPGSPRRRTCTGAPAPGPTCPWC